MLLSINERESKTARNCVFDCHFSRVGRQMAIVNSVFKDFFYLRSSIVLMLLIAAYPVCLLDALFVSPTVLYTDKAEYHMG